MANHDVETEPADQKIDPSKVPWWTSSRLGLAVLGFFGFINVYALRVNMSVAIVCMVNHTAVKEITGGHDTANGSELKFSQCGLAASGGMNVTEQIKLTDGEFVWDKGIQGIILGSFFWGYLSTQIPGGWLATRIGGKRVYGYSMLLAIIGTFITPVAAQTSYIFLIVLRVLVGISSGTCFPAMHALWGSWAPPMERSKLVSFTYAGAQIGNVVTLPLAGLLCKYGFAGGWPSIFYVLGMMSLVWFVLWMLLVSDTPVQHKRISQIEREYILQSLSVDGALVRKSSEEKRQSVPCLKIATSLPMLAILMANVCSDWGTYTLLTGIPMYMNDVLEFDITANGLYSALPYIAFWAVINVSGCVADLLMSHKVLSIIWTRKVFTSVGMVVPALFLIGLGYIDCTQPVVAITLLTLSVSLTGIQYSGWVVNHMDIAPGLAGILFGIANSIAAVTGFLSPVATGNLTKHHSREEWQIVFYISSAIYVFGAAFYIIFASGTVQDWARDTHEADDAETEKLNGTEMVLIVGGKIVKESDNHKLVS
ncbi:hypothetical protein ACJMK2_004912 [Sinanodonta woodiana]|uniref:Major facilitator superfamily (MFS) profile domain-containing protein n=1 Tax=Sinanodonta woodiana TaxID=1069815 RepID=A0ABD3VRG7_SINWO